LENAVKGKVVLLNRAPTLHRLGIQAFYPILVDGKAITIHPLVCSAFNADFDGDQMAVHVPLSEEAQMEAREIMAADKNLLKPGNGRPVASTNMLDIILGCYWMTKIIPGKKGEDKYFADPNSALIAYDFGNIDFRAKIKVMATDSLKYNEYKGKIFDTSAGRLLFNSVLPSDYPFVNKEVDLKLIQRIIDELLENYGVDVLPKLLDKIKNFGFTFVTQSGITWGIDDIKIPEGKKELIDKGKKEMKEIRNQYNEGLLSEEERYRKTIEIWTDVKSEVEALIPDTLDNEGSVYDMVNSGARGSLSQLTQMVGMKGLITSTTGEIIDFPVLSCSKEGFNPIEYFISTHGSRKGMADTALGTAKAGYLTRRLFDVAQDVVILEDDCKTKNGIYIGQENISGIEVSLSKNLRGRILHEDVKGPKGKVLFKKGHLVNNRDAKEMEEKEVKKVFIRSPMTCESRRGICRQCYGIDLGNNNLIDLGEAVGTVAAQAIGEPGTQLTMRTFHAG
ncbi:MAG: DNA-directed RNA polymerase subunit beta', partial [Candidatus Marinimicrobia bacterium]|nr:DNA-directed RNA polymerase subunit beta' [Candidatus Neomarinimicrobiota bacterium]